MTVTLIINVELLVCSTVLHSEPWAPQVACGTCLCLEQKKHRQNYLTSFCSVLTSPCFCLPEFYIFYTRRLYIPVQTAFTVTVSWSHHLRRESYLTHTLQYSRRQWSGSSVHHSITFIVFPKFYSTHYVRKLLQTLLLYCEVRFSEREPERSETVKVSRPPEESAKVFEIYHWQ